MLVIFNACLTNCLKKATVFFNSEVLLVLPLQSVLEWGLCILNNPPPQWYKSVRSGLGLLIVRFLDCGQDSLDE
jgi:hypothetical protein